MSTSLPDLGSRARAASPALCAPASLWPSSSFGRGGGNFSIATGIGGKKVMVSAFCFSRSSNTRAGSHPLLVCLCRVAVFLIQTNVSLLPSESHFVAVL